MMMSYPGSMAISTIYGWSCQDQKAILTNCRRRRRRMVKLPMTMRMEMTTIHRRDSGER